MQDRLLDDTIGFGGEWPQFLQAASIIRRRRISTLSSPRGAIAGWLAELFVKGDERFGVIGHIVLGVVGALVGGFVAGLLTGGNDYVTGINITTIVVATVGAVIAVVGIQRHHRAQPDRERYESRVTGYAASSGEWAGDLVRPDKRGSSFRHGIPCRGGA